MKQDTPAIAKKRARELRTVSQMIAIYCAGNHAHDEHDCVHDEHGDRTERTERAECGEPLCAACKEIDEYAALRTRKCRRMENKISCELCQNHCYAPEMQERIREVMRYAGPRMIWHHPIAAIRHLATKFKRNRAAKRLAQTNKRCSNCR